MPIHPLQQIYARRTTFKVISNAAAAAGRRRAPINLDPHLIELNCVQCMCVAGCCLYILCSVCGWLLQEIKRIKACFLWVIPGTRLISTRRPVTPREPKRQLYGKTSLAGRPPSAFRWVEKICICGMHVLWCTANRSIWIHAGGHWYVNEMIF